MFKIFVENMSDYKSQLLVSIQCFTYNQESYIRQCLDGFVMQKTNFRFEAIVHDDASTDNTAAIVREYAEKYPDIIKPIYESENLYSKDIELLHRIMSDACQGKYIACCEGDDYWTDSMKLQKQVDYLESHPNCTMTCGKALLFSQKENKIIGEQYCQNNNGVLNPEDIINRTGLYIPTCSIVYRRNIMKDYPDYCIKCAVGDYPLQIFCAMRGDVYYFNEPICVYRINNFNSWMGMQKWGTVTDERLSVIRSRVLMLKGFVCDYPHFKKVLEGKIADEINRNVPSWRHPNDVHKYVMYFEEEIKRYNIRWKVDLAIIKCRIPLVRFIYNKLFMRKYSSLSTCY